MAAVVAGRTGEEIGELLLGLSRSGQTLVLVTHNPELAARYTQRTVELVDGQIVAGQDAPARRPSGPARGPAATRSGRCPDDARPGRPCGARRSDPPPGADHRDHPGGAGVGAATFTPAQQRAVTAALRAQPGTAHYVAETDQWVGVAGLTGQYPLTAFRGAAGWTGYQMISGHWYTGPGQAVVSTGFLSPTGKTVGSRVTFLLGGRQIPVRIVGQDFDAHDQGVAMLTSWTTLAQAVPPSLARPGHDAAADDRHGRVLGGRDRPGGRGDRGPGWGGAAPLCAAGHGLGIRTAAALRAE
jgi:hypothetical protein